MISHNTNLYILITIIVIYLIRMLPITLIQKQIYNRFIRSFLFYVPYVTLAVITFPAILDSTQIPLAGGCALVLGSLLSWKGIKMFQVAIACCIIVFLVEKVFI